MPSASDARSVGTRSRKDVVQCSSVLDALADALRLDGRPVRIAARIRRG
jgi:hypothetical protein